MVVPSLIHMAHETLHRLPVLPDDLLIAELLPDGPGDDDARIGPAKTHHVVTILCGRGDAGVASRLALGITHVANPFAKEVIRIGKERTSAGKHLCISRPAQPFVALRAVRGNRQIIGALAPYSIGDQLIDGRAARAEPARFHISRY